MAGGRDAPARRDRAHDITMAAYADVLVLRLGASHYHADCMEALEEALKNAAAASPGTAILIDMERVVLFSSTALRALRSAHQAMERGGGRIVAAAGGELVGSVLRFAPFVKHYPSLEAALDDLSEKAGAVYRKETNR